MRTLTAGITAFRRTPTAILPFAIEGVVVAVLVLVDVYPASGATSPSVAAFPLDIYFDVKQSLAATSGWIFFGLAMIGSVVVRATVLALTLWLVEGRPGRPTQALVRAVKLSGLAAVALFPAAVFMFAGAAIRYSPFIWLGAILGLFPSLYLARAAVRLDVGSGETGAGMPEGFAFLGYAYLVAAMGAAMTSLGNVTTIGTAAIVVCVAPIHGLFLMGWREHLRRGSFPGGGSIAVGLTTVIVILLASTSIYDRYVRDGPPVGRVADRGELLLLGGVDSTESEGALADLDPRRLGFSDRRTTTLSYVGGDAPHRSSDTRGDLDRVAVAVGQQIDEVDPPRLLLGHSQAGLIIDRLLGRGLTPPDRSVVLAPSPVFPPRFEVPFRGTSGPGKPGGDTARGLATVLDALGLQPFDIDAPASPVRLEPVVVMDPDVSRLAVWALGDSVWLDRDWRRPGETNVVAITDHVGVTNNSRALDAATRFLSGKQVADDGSSWRGTLVSLLRYGFEPWQPR